MLHTRTLMPVLDADRDYSGTPNGSTIVDDGSKMIGEVLGIPMVAFIVICICAGIIVIGIFVAVIILCRRGKSSDHNAGNLKEWDDSGNHRK